MWKHLFRNMVDLHPEMQTLVQAMRCMKSVVS
jgi:hypothetical protein